MEAVDTLAASIRKGAVRVDAGLIDDAAGQGIAVFYLNGRSIHTKKDFFRAARDVMKLPDYFGGNWDAFEECINDLSWLPARGYILVYENTSPFFSGNPDDERILKEILHDARENHGQEGVPFEFILTAESLS